MYPPTTNPNGMLLTDGSWIAPAGPTDASQGYVVSIDPRVVTNWSIGQLPCPSNPAPPVGWAYWTGPVSANLTAFASSMTDNPTTYPMGSFVQAVVDGQLVSARVEWHTSQGATGATGCFRGTNLFKQTG